MTGLSPPTRINGRVLIVGASDASGSTGIQAAIKSISALGAFAAAAVTAVIIDEAATSHEVPPVAVAQQMRAVLADIGADVLLIGGLAGAGTIEAVADVLDGEARGIPLVLDLTDAATALLPLARIAGAALVTSLSRGDVLADGTTLSVFPPRRGTDRPVRGAAITLAAAVAAGLAQGLPLAAAVRRGRDYVEEAILTAPDFGRGPSPLNHVHTNRHTPAASFES